MTIIILEDTNRLKGYRDQDFLSNKKEREKEREGAAKKKKKNSTLLSYTRNYGLICSIH